MTAIDRRLVIAGGLGALAVRPSAAAETPQSPVAHGVLAQNPLAHAFRISRATLPSVYLWGPNGRRSIDDLKGRTILMPLWAEWCAPCFSELPDFARLQKKYGNKKFVIMPVLTGPEHKLTPATLAPILALAQASIFEPIIENNLGNTLLHTMAVQDDGAAAVPCNLLIAPDGRVVGREMGRINPVSDPGAAPPKTAKEMLLRTQAGEVQSLWGQQPGEEFAAAMANGFLA